MAYIKNRDQLLSHGNVAARRVALDIVEYALMKADPYEATRALVTFQNNTLSVGDLLFDLKSHPRIFILGAGKATYPIAKALEDILGHRITDGIVVCKYGQQGELSRSRLYLAGHPIPDESGLKASQKALELAARTQAGDLVFGCVTGGSSALFPLPAAGVTLEDKQKLTGLLLSCGANIVEINSVRKHVSRIKGGRLAMAIHPGAHLINLTVSDVIGDPLDYITDPTVPDTSTLDDARSTLTKFDLWQKVPMSISRLLKDAGPQFESPKVGDFDGYHREDFIVVKGTTACKAAVEKATRLGFDTLILSTMLEGESKELGRTFGAIAGEILLNHQPVTPPGVVIGGGETTVTISGLAGQGGPNQEFAVSAALAVEDLGNVVVVGLDTDGTDGPTDQAGAITDNTTATRARAAGVDLFGELRKHNVTPCLQKLGDSIFTGATGTNVNDLKIMIVLPDPIKY